MSVKLVSDFKSLNPSLYFKQKLILIKYKKFKINIFLLDYQNCLQYQISFQLNHLWGNIKTTKSGHQFELSSYPSIWQEI